MAEQRNALANFFHTSARQPWVGKFFGTALSLPEEYRKATLRGDLYIEYLQVGSGRHREGDTPNKNHVVFQVPFAKRIGVEDSGKLVLIMGARISMEITEEVGVLDDIDEEHVEAPYSSMGLCKGYYPGTLYVKLLKYDGRTRTANKLSRFTELKFATLGEFVDFFASKNLHRMSFLGYGDAWKGCRDFIMQSFLQMRLANKVTEIDQDGQTLKENITRVYHDENGSSHAKLIDRGKFLGYNPIFPNNIKGAYETESIEA